MKNNLNNFVDNFFIENNIKYVLISAEILKILNLKHTGRDITQDLELFLNQKFLSLLNLTFSEKIVFYYSEVLTEEILTIVHNYFRNKCCNIENIVFLTSTSGLKTYYKNFCNLYRTNGMTIVEIPMIDLVHKFCNNLSQKKIHKNIKRKFSIYGGTYDIDPPERTFLLLLLSQFAESSNIEILSKCKPETNLRNWLERETFFVNSEFVEHYCNLHKTFIDDKLNLSDSLKLKINKTAVSNEPFGANKYQETMDSHCLFNLVRETINFQSFAYISEKTFRCFYNHVIPIPIVGKEIIEDFKRFGFWIDTDFVDYSYLQADLFVDRANALAANIRNLDNLSIRDLSDYYNSNIAGFEHNQRLVVDWPNQLEKILKEKFDNHK